MHSYVPNHFHFAFLPLTSQETSKSTNGNSQLHDAVLTGNFYEVKELLLHRSMLSDVFAKNNDGSTPGHLAAASGTVEILKLLFAASSGTAQHYNILRQRAKNSLLRELAEKDLTFVEYPNDATLIELQDHKDGVPSLQLTKTSPTWWEHQDQLFGTPLHAAAARGHVEAVKVILKRVEEAHGEMQQLYGKEMQHALNTAVTYVEKLHSKQFNHHDDKKMNGLESEIRQLKQDTNTMTEYSYYNVHQFESQIADNMSSLKRKQPQLNYLKTKESMSKKAVYPHPGSLDFLKKSDQMVLKTALQTFAEAGLRRVAEMETKDGVTSADSLVFHEMFLMAQKQLSRTKNVIATKTAFDDFVARNRTLCGTKNRVYAAFAEDLRNTEGWFDNTSKRNIFNMVQAAFKPLEKRSFKIFGALGHVFPLTSVTFYENSAVRGQVALNQCMEAIANERIYKQMVKRASSFWLQRLASFMKASHEGNSKIAELLLPRQMFNQCSIVNVLTGVRFLVEFARTPQEFESYQKDLKTISKHDHSQQQESISNSQMSGSLTSSKSRSIRSVRSSQTKKSILNSQTLQQSVIGASKAKEVATFLQEFIKELK